MHNERKIIIDKQTSKQTHGEGESRLKFNDEKERFYVDGF
jgi:hypothetical protein